MIGFLLLGLQSPPELRTPAIYRIPASVVRLDKLEEMMTEDYYDGYCVEPKPSAEIKAILAKGKVRLVPPREIDTAANLKWRNALISLTKGEISPREWVNRTKNLRETVHFLSSPNTRKLREEIPKSAQATFAQMLILCLPGRPCFTSTDVWQARWWPENDRAYESWILAMKDHLGPMLYQRATDPRLGKAPMTVVSAPAKPGLFVFKRKDLTFYFNSSAQPVRLPKIDLDNQGSIARGLIVEDDYIELAAWGSLMIDPSFH